VGEVGDADRDLIGRMFAVGAELAKREGIAEGGYRLVVNVGRNGGQTVDHLHVHMLGGRQMTWPPG
jgi:histidine triad (HIT) family protein